MNTAHTKMNKWAFEQVSIGKEEIILDIGCGGGKTIQLLSKLSAHGKIYGIDYSQQAVKDSIRANNEDVEAGKVDIRQASVTALPFQEHTFNVATAFQTHYFWPELENSVKEVYRVLKPEGYLILTAEIYKINYHMNSYKTIEEMDQLLKETGFNNVSIFKNQKKKWTCIQGMK